MFFQVNFLLFGAEGIVVMAGEGRRQGKIVLFWSGSWGVSEEQARQCHGAMAQGWNVKSLMLPLWKCSLHKETFPLPWARPDWLNQLHQEVGFLENEFRGLPWQGEKVMTPHQGCSRCIQKWISCKMHKMQQTYSFLDKL